MRKGICTVIVLVLLLSAVGCSSTHPPDRVVRTFLDTMVKGDFEEAAKLAGGANMQKDVLQTTENKQSEQLARAILARVKYELGDKRVEGEKAIVNVKVTAPDLLRITSKAVGELLPMAFAMAFSQDQSQEKTDALFQQYFENAINDPNAPMVTSDVQIKLQKKDGSWVVVPDESFVNAITGNMAKAFAGLEKNETKRPGS